MEKDFEELGLIKDKNYFRINFSLEDLENTPFKPVEKGKNVYSVLMENTPKTFLIAEGRSYLDPEKQIEHALGSFRKIDISILGQYF